MKSMSRLGSLLVSSVLSALALTAYARDASALPEPSMPMGARGQLAIDQISGFRVQTNAADAPIAYYGPIGFDMRSWSSTNLPNGTGQTTYHYTTFFFAPSADYFVIDHLSVGGLLEISSTSGSVDLQGQNGVVDTVSLPGTTNFTLLPRVGYLIELNNRFALWPRAGIGYVSRSSVVDQGTPNAFFTDTTHGMLIDLDLGVVFRLTDTFFVKAAPQISTTLGASHSETRLNVEQTADASLFQFALVTGVGGFFDLL